MAAQPGSNALTVRPNNRFQKVGTLLIRQDQAALKSLGINRGFFTSANRLAWGIQYPRESFSAR